MDKKILVTDANYKHTLGIIRSLGSRSLELSCGSTYSKHIPISAYSKYVKTSYFYPDPNRSSEFCNYIKKIMKRDNIETLIPVGYDVYSALARYSELFKEYNIPMPNTEAFRIAASKSATVSLAKELKMPTPSSTKINSINELTNIKLNFPIVVKGIFSSGYVKYAKNNNELKYWVDQIKKIQGEFPLIQEYISGDGYGFFGLFNNGICKAHFMHRRIREFPVTGGPSTCAESVYDERLLKYGLTIMEKLKWHGVAMVEFKKDVNDDNFKIMEINPKFWGSLDLAIASGVDFPYLLYKMITEGDIKKQGKYKVGLRYMWPFPDDFNRVIANPINLKYFLNDMINPEVKKNINLNDFEPNLMQLNLSLYKILKKSGENI